MAGRGHCRRGDPLHAAQDTGQGEDGGVVPLLPPVALALEALPREKEQVLPSIAASYSRGSWRIDGPAVALVQAAVGGDGKPTGEAPAQRQRTRARLCGPFAADNLLHPGRPRRGHGFAVGHHDRRFGLHSRQVLCRCRPDTGATAARVPPSASRQVHDGTRARTGTAPQAGRRIAH